MPIFGSTKQHNTLTRDRHQGDFVDQSALGNDPNYPRSHDYASQHHHAGGMGNQYGGADQMYPNDQFAQGNNTMNPDLRDTTYNSGVGTGTGMGAGHGTGAGYGTGADTDGIPTTSAMNAGANSKNYGAGHAMTGKVEQVAGTMLGSKSLHAKGLQKEQEAKAAKIQSRELAEAERLEQEAMARRQRAVAHGAHPANRPLGGGEL